MLKHNLWSIGIESLTLFRVGNTDSAKGILKCRNELQMRIIRDLIWFFYHLTFVGTRQGCIGSPKIFLLLINDLVSFLESRCNHGIFVTNEIPDVLTLMFADDVASFSDTVARVQKLIDLIAQFCKIVGMDLNLEKKLQ